MTTCYMHVILCGWYMIDARLLNLFCIGDYSLAITKGIVASSRATGGADAPPMLPNPY